MADLYIARNSSSSSGSDSNKTDISFATVTLASGTLTYDGTLKTQGVDSVVVNGITLTENVDYTVMNNAYTDAGSYTLTITGIGVCKGTKNISWSIAKAQRSISVNPSALTIWGVNETDTFTVSYIGDGTLSVSSSDNSVATVTISGTTVTITSVAGGSAAISVALGEGTNYLGTTASIAVTVRTGIYGAEWDGSASTSWSRTDDAALFTDPVPYVAGATSYGSPFDDCMPWSGMEIVEDNEAGTMVSIPKFWYKLTQSGTGMKIQIADNAVEGFSVSPAHMDRGDGKGERDVVYIGRYHCGATAYKSASGQKPKVEVTRADFRTNIHNLGSTIWQADWAMRFTLFLLYLVEFANWNSQDKIGYGCGNGYGFGGTQSMGYTDSMPYHTGTTQSNRTTYGFGTQYRYIEGLWDNVYDCVDGCYNDSTGLKLILDPSKFGDDFSASLSGILVGNPKTGYPSAFSVKNVSGTFPLFIPSANDGSDSTYSCDYWYYSKGQQCTFAGGNYEQSLGYGLFRWYCNNTSWSSTYLGSRLMKLP